jgi:hypothetical protein
MPEPIEVLPGVYTIPGGREVVVGLCIMIDNLDAQWEVVASDIDTTVIKINRGANWNAQVVTDPKTGIPKLQLFREGAKLNRLVQKFIHTTEGEYTHDASEANDAGPVLKIFYDTPEDSQTPPKKKKKP